MEYICKVGTPAGEIVERSFDAPNEEALRADLLRQGLFLFSHRKVTQGFRFGAPRVKPESLQLFGQELAALLKAGLPLAQSMDLMVERQRDPLFKRSLAAVRDRIKSGAALSESFRQEGALYPQMFSASLVAGERSGNLEAVLRRFVSYVKLNQAIKKKVIAASVYPMVLFSGMFGLMYVMLTRVLPQFTEFYGSLGAQLPLPTRVLMGLSDQARQWSLPILAVLVVGGFALATWLQASANRERFDGWILRIPFFGALMRTYSTSQLARSLSTLLSGGLPLVQALGVASASVGNRAISAAAAAAVPQIQEGKSLSLALDATGHVEPLTVEMIRVGENTGALGEMLNQVADFYDEDLEVKVQTILALVEPVLLVFMAVVIGSMVLALYLPMFEAFSALQSRGGG
ncbi:MAG TPA: type II secretion system F family protein [Vicinamibacteria bacterium]|nr:type II secretion system F family protein [Vicinamibacteria bacterium]HRB12938.1 type II secretion system F family protein [Vicinamibacteria bacterium]